MKKNKALYGLTILVTVFAFSCKKKIEKNENEMNEEVCSTVVAPVDINKKGFDLLTKLQGQWVGINQVAGLTFDWFAFDFRAVSKAHILAIYEGGEMGNLFNSFFITNFKGKQTIMVRNGGLLGGIYRTSYFVLDEVRNDSDGDFYRLVDAYGGKASMWMELRFKGDSLYYNAYTSKLGLSVPPTRHMTFKGKRNIKSLSESAANLLSFPKKDIEFDFSNGFNEDHLYVNVGEDKPKSASFLSQASGNESLETLAFQSGDPYSISDYSYISKLDIVVQRTAKTINKKLYVFLSNEALVDASGNFLNTFDSVLQFPELGKSQSNFQFTYLHPGEYYLTVISDTDEKGDVFTNSISNTSVKITVAPNSTATVVVNNLTIQH